MFISDVMFNDWSHNIGMNSIDRQKYICLTKKKKESKTKADMNGKGFFSFEKLTSFYWSSFKANYYLPSYPVL